MKPKADSNVWRLDPATFEYKEREFDEFDENNRGPPILPLTVGKMGKSERPHVRYNPSHLGLHVVPEERLEAHTGDHAYRIAVVYGHTGGHIDSDAAISGSTFMTGTAERKPSPQNLQTPENKPSPQKTRADSPQNVVAHQIIK